MFLFVVQKELDQPNTVMMDQHRHPTASPHSSRGKKITNIPSKGIRLESKEYTSNKSSSDSCTSEEEDSCAESVVGRKVDSPVGGRSPVKNNKSSSKKPSHKRKRSYSSSDSREGSPQPSTSSRTSSSSKRKHSKSDKGEEKKSQEKSQDKRSVSPKRSVRRSVSVDRSETDLMPPPTSTPVVTPQAPTTAPVFSEHLNETVYRNLMVNKPPSIVEHDTQSKASSRQSKKRTTPRPPTTEELKKYVAEDLRGCDLVNQTIKRIHKIYSSDTTTNTIQKKNAMTEAVGQMRCIPIGSSVDDSDTPKDYPCIDDGAYIFSALRERSFGYNCADMKSDCGEQILKCSLIGALYPNCIETKHSLDMVFRSSMKELAKEISNCNSEDNMSLENPILISGKYLEMRLLQKIQRYYKQHQNEDIIDYLTSSLPNENLQLSQLVSGCRCEAYIRKLCDRYDIRHRNLEEVSEEELGIPQEMRVWTDRSNQLKTELMLLNNLSKVYTEIEARCTTFRDEKSKLLAFVQEYTKQMEPFMMRHNDFLSEMLKRSELMSWMCLGITTNEKTGLMNMVVSYMAAQKVSNLELSNPSICWNYPLTKMFRGKASTKKANKTLIDLNGFLSDAMSMISDATTDAAKTDKETEPKGN